MRITRTFVLLTSLALAAPFATSACGGAKSKPKMAAVKPGNMPSGASWDGVYFSPLWGNLHIVADGNSVKGRWRRPDGSAWGEMTGKITGNVLRFEWVEHKIGMVGPASITKGRGYFRYVRPEGDNVDDKLIGEWGFEDAEIGGGEWDCVKQRNKKPDLDSVKGDDDLETWR